MTDIQKQMAEQARCEQLEQKGYDDFLDIWARQDSRPTVTQCPARYMTDAFERSAYLRGWRKASNE